MNIQRTIRKNKKALSPVVASIILIAVTVAVSVAVAAWMGGMTIGFMGTSSVTVTDITFTGDSNTEGNTIDLTLKNTGTKTISIAAVKVNNQAATTAETLPLSLPAGNSTTLSLTTIAPWIDGNTYKVDLYDGNNQVIGSAQQNAPGA